MRVSVIGGSRVTDDQYDTAQAVGRELARRDHEVVCGGLGGVMAAVCEGAREEGGRTIGILPGDDPSAANEDVQVPVATGTGAARNAMVVANGAGAIAIGGRYGTLSEIALALDRGLAVAGIDTHDVEGVEAVTGPIPAVDHVESTA